MELNEQLKEFNKRRDALSEMIAEASEELTELDLEVYSDNLKKLEQKLGSETFKIMVMGNFKNGKSTFINSLLGQEVLPAYAAPATAIINEVKYGAQKKAMLYFRNPLPPLDESVSPRAREHIKSYNGNNVAPMEIPVDGMEDYLVIPLGMERDEASKKSPYEKAELFWPLELLKNNVEIVDSPGLNEDPERTAVTLSYLGQADAILFTFDATHFVSMTELEYIDTTLAEFGFDKKSIFGVINRFDQLPTERDKKQIEGLAQKTLKDRTEHICYTAALRALEGKLKGDAQLLESSGIPRLEAELADYLANDRGRIKLSSPAKELLNILRENVLNSAVPQRRGMLSTELSELKDRYESRKPDISNLRAQRELILTRAQAQISLMENDVKRFATNYLNEFPTLVNSWINEYAPQTKVEIIHPKASTEKLVNEMIDYVNKRIDAEFRSWVTGPLTSLLNEKAEQLMQSMQGHVQEFYIKLDQIMFDVSGVKPPENNIPAWKRVVATAGGWFFSGAGGALVGAQEGLTKSFAITVAKQLAVQVGVIIVANIVGMMNPIVLASVIVAQVIAVLAGQGSKTTNLAKEKLSEAYCNFINEQALELSGKIVDSSMKQIASIKDMAGDALSKEIEQMENQLDSIIAEMEQGKDNIKLQQEKLDVSEEKIRSLEKKLTEFVFELLK